MKLVYLKDLETLTNGIAEKTKKLLGETGDIQGDYIVSGSQTTTSTEDGGENTYTFTKSNGETSTFTVRNGLRGAKGEKGDTGAKGEKGDTGARGEKGEAGARGSRWHHGTRITGTDETGEAFSESGVTEALAGDYYLNTNTGHTYMCTTPGDANTARWAYVGSLKGEGGDVDEITESDIDRIVSGDYSEKNNMEWRCLV